MLHPAYQKLCCQRTEVHPFIYAIYPKLLDKLLLKCCAQLLRFEYCAPVLVHQRAELWLCYHITPLPFGPIERVLFPHFLEHVP